MAKRAVLERVENKWFSIPKQEFIIGYEDPESDDGPERFFAWDNEREPYDVVVPAMEAQARPVSVGEYAKFLVSVKKETNIPVLWVKLSKYTGDGHENAVGSTNGHTNDHSNGHANGGTNGETNGQAHDHTDDLIVQHDDFGRFVSQHGIRTVWGPIPLSQALDWPCTASYNEMADYANWVGGVRIPTLHEVRSIHYYAERLRRASGTSMNKYCHTDPSSIFVDLTGANVGLQNFHPTPVTQNGGRLCGLGDLGGAWEWTSTILEPQPGFKPMDIYPGYSADFMDGKHIAITGGSWAVPPRIAGRKSFLNWWQKNYPYPWVALRLVRDATG